MATRQIIINVPEKILLAEKTTEADFAQEVRLLAAIKLYELGRFTSGRAAELAGMSRVEFLLALEKYKVFPLGSELSDLEGHPGPNVLAAFFISTMGEKQGAPVRLPVG